MSTTPHPGLEIDGYRLVRQIGQGGFGSVWLCWSEATQSFHALKWVSGHAGEAEQQALVKFREVSQRLRSPNLIAIEHINRLPDALIYTLPLADGQGAEDPADEKWHPQTLADRIATKKAPWFSASEIKELLLPIIRTTAKLNEAGLVHRDIKPANILFFGGIPCLADVGLLSNDGTSLSQRGTPGFLAPSWYLETSGQPDMWGLATTLYSLLTGNNPDKMGRPKFLWPPAGKQSLPAEEQKEWLRLHSVIYRATHEKASERFLDFHSFAEAVEGNEQPSGKRKRNWLGLGLLIILLSAILGWLWMGKVATQEIARTAEEPIDFPQEAANNNFPDIEPGATGVSPARKQEFDSEAQTIVQKLEAHKADTSADLEVFRESCAAVLKKMRAYSPAFSINDQLRELSASLAMLPGKASGGNETKNVDSQKQAASKKEADHSQLLEIRDELQRLASNLSSGSFHNQMTTANSLFQTLVEAAYEKTISADEKFYFNDHVRPKLNTEFSRIFEMEPGSVRFETIGVNMQIALANPKWSEADPEIFKEIKAAISEIQKGLEPK